MLLTPGRPSAAPSRTARLAGGLLAAWLTLGSLGACSLGSDNVSCSGTSCSVTLSGNGAKADVLGNTVTLSGISNGKATLGAGDSSVSCAQGQSVTAGPLHLTCSTITTDAVTLTASLG